MADALEAGPAKLLVRDALVVERALQLQPSLALAAEHLREILRVARRLLFHERHLAEVRVDLLARALLALVDLGEIHGHPRGLRVREIGDAHRLLQQLAEHVRSHLAGREMRERGRHLDALDHLLRGLAVHQDQLCARIPRIVSMSSSGPNGFVRYCVAPAAKPMARSLSLS